MRCRACATCATSAGAGACPRCRERDRRRATHRRAVARCQKSADSGSHRPSRSLRLLCHPGEFHSGSTTGTGCPKFFFDSHWPARRVGLNVAQGKGEDCHGRSYQSSAGRRRRGSGVAGIFVKRCGGFKGRFRILFIVAHRRSRNSGPRLT